MTEQQHPKNWRDRLSPNHLRIMINLWPPFLGGGIKVLSISSDYRQIKVALKMHWYNKNYVGTHFGGSMFAMTDPFYMLMLMKNLGREYIVWDKAASIVFKKPARGTLYAMFIFTEEELENVRRNANENEKYFFDKPVDIINEQDEIVASVIRTLFVQQKKYYRPKI